VRNVSQANQIITPNPLVALTSSMEIVIRNATLIDRRAPVITIGKLPGQTTRVKTFHGFALKF
jgi:hypothetical protein